MTLFPGQRKGVSLSFFAKPSLGKIVETKAKRKKTNKKTWDGIS